jgi:hypothetical protein
VAATETQSKQLIFNNVAIVSSLVPT